MVTGARRARAARHPGSYRVAAFQGPWVGGEPRESYPAVMSELWLVERKAVKVQVQTRGRGTEPDLGTSDLGSLSPKAVKNWVAGK